MGERYHVFFGRLVLGDEVGEGYAAQMVVDGVVQAFPQVVGDAGRAAVAIGFAAALGGIQPVFGGGDDLGDVDLAGGFAQHIAAARPAHAFH